MNLTGEDGKKHEKVSTFEAGIMSGTEIQGDVIQNGTYLNWKGAQQAARSNFSSAKKEESITKFQDRKAEQIATAQDRTAMVWAKYGACEIIAHHPAFKNLSEAQIATEITNLANKIYNDDLLPF